MTNYKSDVSDTSLISKLIQLKIYKFHKNFTSNKSSTLSHFVKPHPQNAPGKCLDTYTTISQMHTYMHTKLMYLLKTFVEAALRSPFQIVTYTATPIQYITNTLFVSIATCVKQLSRQDRQRFRNQMETDFLQHYR